LLQEGRKAAIKRIINVARNVISASRRINKIIFVVAARQLKQVAGRSQTAK
jgi:hypothetical protein